MCRNASRVLAKVALRPAKGSAAEPALASGVVYRIREDALTVALEEAPDEALDQPLRLDKLANEARTPAHEMIWEAARPSV